jgi:hypothetical protein
MTDFGLSAASTQKFPESLSSSASRKSISDTTVPNLAQFEEQSSRLLETDFDSPAGPFH